MSDIFSKILNNAMKYGFMKELYFDKENCVLNLSFADDTLIFLKADYQMVEALKLLLIGFEHLASLKIKLF